MRDIIGKASRTIFCIQRRLFSEIRKFAVKCQNPRCKFEPGVFLESGILIRVIGTGTLVIGKNTLIKSGCVIVCKNAELRIGSNCFLGWGSVICANRFLQIGNDALIAEHVTIRDQDHGTSIIDQPFRQQDMVCKPINIEDNVWIGAKATVLKGCRIGSNSVVGANAVVSRSFKPNSIIAGVPARLIRELHRGQAR